MPPRTRIVAAHMPLESGRLDPRPPDQIVWSCGQGGRRRPGAARGRAAVSAARATPRRRCGRSRRPRASAARQPALPLPRRRTTCSAPCSSAARGSCWRARDEIAKPTTRFEAFGSRWPLPRAAARERRRPVHHALRRAGLPPGRGRGRRRPRPGRGVLGERQARCRPGEPPFAASPNLSCCGTWASAPSNWTATWYRKGDGRTRATSPTCSGRTCRTG